MKSFVLVLLAFMALCAPLTGCQPPREEPVRVEIQSLEIEREVDADEFENIKNRLTKPEPPNKNDLRIEREKHHNPSPLPIATPPTNVPIRPRYYRGFRRRWPAPTPLSAMPSPLAAMAMADIDTEFNEIAVEAYLTTSDRAFDNIR